jgi:hypothetical protein
MKKWVLLFLKMRFLSAYLIILSVCLLLYWPTLNYGLTYLDDNVWVLEYQWFFQRIENSVHILTKPDFISGIFYRPLLNFTFMLNANLLDGRLISYRLFNIILHVLNGFLVFRILVRFEYRRELALYWSLIFCVHPVLVSAVAWIPGRTDSLLAFFCFSSFLFFMKYTGTRNILYSVIHLLLFICALGVKETAIMLPLVCGVYYYLLVRPGFLFRSMHRLIATWFFLIVFWMDLHQLVLIDAPHITFEMMRSSVLKNSPALISYLGKAFLPFNLSVLPYLKDLTLIYGGVTILLMGLFCFKGFKRRYRFIFFGMLWFMCFLVPSLVLSFIKHEYRLYVPLLGFIICAQELFIATWFDTRRYVVRVMMISILIVFCFFTLIHSHHYHNHYAFWENAVKTSPNSPLAHRNLGAMYYMEGRFQEAKTLFRQAVKLNPKEKMVNMNLGLIEMQSNNFRQAEMHFLRESQINPYYDSLYMNWGILAYQTGRYSKAESLWWKAIDVNPQNVKSHQNLLVLYLNQGKQYAAEQLIWIMQDKGIAIPDEYLIAYQQLR